MADVMVVDDDDDIRELIAMRVRRLGHRVTSVGDPGAALAHASTADVDLALLDWSMPAMNGGELCAACVSWSTWPTRRSSWSPPTPTGDPRGRLRRRSDRLPHQALRAA